MKNIVAVLIIVLVPAFLFSNELKNLNPDKSGEPWIDGGALPDQEVHRFLPVVQPVRSRTLPDEVILLNKPEFPEVFSQGSTGSCAQSSAIGYAFSYQVNCILERVADSLNMKAPGFTYNFLNNGDKSQGSTYTDGLNMCRETGAPDVSDFNNSLFGDSSCSYILNGAEKWQRANDILVDSLFQFTLETEEDIYTIKQWLYDLGGRDTTKRGGAVLIAIDGSTVNPSTEVSSGPYAGDGLCETLNGDTVTHAVTIAGYSDYVGESGAFLIVNSWGKNWATNGYVWVPYEVLLRSNAKTLTGFTVKKYDALYEIKANLFHESRKLLQFSYIWSDDTSCVDFTDLLFEENNFTSFFPFDLRCGDVPLEGVEFVMGIDALYPPIVDSPWVFFLKYYSNYKIGGINYITFIDHRSGVPVETIITDVPDTTTDWHEDREFRLVFDKSSENVVSNSFQINKISPSVIDGRVVLHLLGQNAINVSLFTVSGKEVWKNEYLLKKGKHSIALPQERFAQGIYFLEIDSKMHNCVVPVRF